MKGTTEKHQVRGESKLYTSLVTYIRVGAIRASMLFVSDKK